MKYTKKTGISLWNTRERSKISHGWYVAQEWGDSGKEVLLDVTKKWIDLEEKKGTEEKQGTYMTRLDLYPQDNILQKKKLQNNIGINEKPARLQRSLVEILEDLLPNDENQMLSSDEENINEAMEIMDLF